MAKQKSVSAGNAARIILSIYIAICTVIVLIILLSPFQPTTNSVLNSDIYLRTATSETSTQ